MEQISFHSHIVVISWWSNCLALACLNRLLAFTQNREIFIIQVGKSHEQSMRFLQQLPSKVTVLPYPLTLPAEHSRVLHNVVFRQMPDAQGIWFIDHDTLLEDNFEPWFYAADSWLAKTNCCLAIPCRKNTEGGITSPFFWISPYRWPKMIDSFDPVPFNISEQNQRPDREYLTAPQRKPESDTLMRAKEALEKQGRVAVFPMRVCPMPQSAVPPPPRFRHYGGLSLLSSARTTSSENTPWIRRTIRRFSKFYLECPASWIAIEDQVLLQRLGKYQTLGQKTAKYLKMLVHRFET